MRAGEITGGSPGAKGYCITFHLLSAISEM
jgi:hypothetical protein